MLDPNSTPKLLTSQDLERLPVYPPDHRLPYGEDAQFADLYLPDGADRTGPHPVVVLIHGGCWRAKYGLEHLSPLAKALAAEGVAVWSLEYRRLGSGGGWPHTFLDVAAGADLLRDVADTYALDLSRVVTAGHSAGGHLALWLAGRHRLPRNGDLWTPNPLRVRGAVSLAGIPDLGEALAQGVCKEAAGELLGGSPDTVPERYAQGSPARLLPLGVPQHLLSGDRDEIVPAAYAHPYAEAAEAHGDTVTWTLLPNAGHFELVIPGSIVWERVRGVVLELLHA